jgi:6-phosphofructokinase 2
MKLIVTITLNPAIDGASETEKVQATRKVRTTKERYDPGGGGINVARVLAELGCPALPVYLAGGATGTVFDDLLAARGLAGRRIPIRDHTRISQAIFERSSGLEYRFVPEGPVIAAEEARRLLKVVEDLDFDYCVASGSLPRGVPSDFYVALTRIVDRKKARLILDTSGAELKAAVAAGGLYLIKPSLGEFESLVGRPLREPSAQEVAAWELVSRGGVEMVAVSLGHEGALLTTRAGVTRLRPPPIEAKSAVGAGDSFVGGMTFALAEGWPPEDAFKLGVAAGSAAVLTPGTELCRREDVWRLYGALGGRTVEPLATPRR